MAKLNSTNEFEYSFKGLFSIINSRKLYKKKPYRYSTILLLILSLLFFFTKDYFCDVTYFKILKSFTSTYLPALITFSGFSMTAYSLVVGFLNYGVFKTTIEEWYTNKIKTCGQKNDKKNLEYSVYQEGIALFAITILLLLTTVFIALLVKLIVDLEIVIGWKCIEVFNSFIMLILVLLTNYCFILIFYNIVNIFTFSQALNQMIYFKEFQKANKSEDNGSV
ncbi:hypothetical protein [Elizabethkingia meningoseptica]|uniref:hypothetical protein n=1 Tax=Elizabethkingia meningoseptica TaxID=238 RepID=UPI0023B02BD5|nr:hypothetical protein [Elizabethkingia meningoseptica]MDE5490649.1 hypothetical protein [Elizabethkingia meningoseptica]